MITVDFECLGIRFSDCNGLRVLDIGCGSGRHIGALYEYDNIVSVGVDKNTKDLKNKQKRIKVIKQMGLVGTNLQLLCVSDAGRLPFKDISFDVVICSEVLEHIPDHHTVIREFTRVLKPGGSLAVSAPRYFPERICWMLSNEYRQTEGGHVRIYRKKQLVALLHNAGLILKTWHYAHSLHTPYWWLKCLAGPARTDNLTVNLYHRFLVYDIMTKSRLTQRLERLLNPFMGKSLVLYLKKAD